MRKILRIDPSAEIKESLQDAVDQGLAWSDFDNRLVRSGLRKMQRGLCAYCEDRLNAVDAKTRIDHFVPRSSPAGKPLVYEWTNLFLSCDCHETCDSRKKSHTDEIVNPCMDEPSDYLAYLPTGTMVPVSGANNPKGAATIRVLNPNGGLLPIRRVREWNRHVKYWRKFSVKWSSFSTDDFLRLPFGTFFVYMAKRSGSR